MSFLSIHNISKQFGSVHALKGISLSFNLGEFVVIVGPSGCGKTTLLNIIGLIDTPDSGTIYLNSEKVNKKKYQTFRYNYYASIYQNYHLIPYYTVDQNLNIGCLNRKESKEERSNLLEGLGINNKDNSYPDELSGGEQQRIAISRALMTNPKVLLADEPTGALDSKNADKVMELLVNNSEGRLIIMVTHNLQLASKYASRIITIKDGTIESDINNKETMQVDYGQASYHYHSFRIQEVLNNTIKSYHKRKKGLFGIIILATICFFFIIMVFASFNGITTYTNILLNSRLDASYIDIQYFKDDKCTAIPQSFYNQLLSLDIVYTKADNYNYILNSQIKHLFGQKELFDFYFDISVISFASLSKLQTSLINQNDGIDYDKIIINKLMLDKIESQDKFLVKGAALINESIYDIDWSLSIGGIVDDGSLYNTPKIFMDQAYTASLFSFLDSNVLFSSPLIPTRFHIYSNFSTFYDFLLSSTNAYSLFSTSEHSSLSYFIYDTPTLILRTSLSSILESFKLIFLAALLMIFLANISLLSLTLTYLLRERMLEIALLQGYGAKNNDIMLLPLCEGFMVLTPSLLVSFVLSYLCQLLAYQYSGQILNQTWNYKLIQIGGDSIIAAVFACVISLLIPSFLAIRNLSKNTISEALKDE